MKTVFLVTSSDSRRPNLAYKIEFETDAAFQRWFSHEAIALSRNERFMATAATKRPANTILTIVNVDGSMEAKDLDLTWADIVRILQEADDLQRDAQRVGSGRYPKRVLMTTTSKERREGRKSGAFSY